jgi:hypothetical protein
VGGCCKLLATLHEVRASLDHPHAPDISENVKRLVAAAGRPVPPLANVPNRISPRSRLKNAKADETLLSCDRSAITPGDKISPTRLLMEVPLTASRGARLITVNGTSD